MTAADILRIRLDNQQLSATSLKTPAEVVHWMGAIQAQEYAMAKWAIGLRLKDVPESIIEKAFNDGAILRTHVMRPTWHFVAPEDIRWLLALTAPRVHQASAYMHRQLNFTPSLLKRSNDAIAKALEGGNHLTRTDLQKVLKQKKIIAAGFHLGHLMMYAELEQVICSGPRQGKQFTYALLDERVPPVKPISRDEALSKLAHRYFTSRGPTTLQDFSYWSGLTMKDAVAGAATLNSSFNREVMDGKEYIFVTPSTKNKIKLDNTFLMPDYDEYGMSYKDRSVISNLKKTVGPRASIVFNRFLVIDGRISGSWNRTFNKDGVQIKVIPFAPLSKVKMKAMASAMKRFHTFLNIGSSKKSNRKK